MHTNDGEMTSTAYARKRNRAWSVAHRTLRCAFDEAQKKGTSITRDPHKHQSSRRFRRQTIGRGKHKYRHFNDASYELDDGNAPSM